MLKAARADLINIAPSSVGWALSVVDPLPLLTFISYFRCRQCARPTLRREEDGDADNYLVTAVRLALLSEQGGPCRNVSIPTYSVGLNNRFQLANLKRCARLTIPCRILRSYTRAIGVRKN